MLSNKMGLLIDSVTLQISGKAKKLKSQGVEVINLSVGEPDFPTPENAKNAGIQAIQENFTGYTQVDGIPELKLGICDFFRKDGLNVTPKQTMVCPGAKLSIYLALMALINDGDEVIVPAPYWVTYPEQVKLAGGREIIVNTSENTDFLITPDLLKRNITPNTRVLILNNPSNPTGAVYTREQLEALGELVKKHKIWVIADEIYSKISYDNFQFTRFAALDTSLSQRTITIDGASKVFSMTGWRIGFAAGPEPIIQAMKKIQGHLTSNPCSISQKAVLGALNSPENASEIERRRQEFQNRRDFLVNNLNKIPGLLCFMPKGAFYAFPNVSSYYGMSDGSRTIQNSVDMSDYLLDKARVATVPGDGFGAENNIRLSFAASKDDLKHALRYISDSLGDLGKI